MGSECSPPIFFSNICDSPILLEFRKWPGDGKPPGEVPGERPPGAVGGFPSPWNSLVNFIFLGFGCLEWIQCVNFFFIFFPSNWCFRTWDFHQSSKHKHKKKRFSITFSQRRTFGVGRGAGGGGGLGFPGEQSNAARRGPKNVLSVLSDPAIQSQESWMKKKQKSNTLQKENIIMKIKRKERGKSKKENIFMK